MVQFVTIAVIARHLSSDDLASYFVVMGIVLATYFAAGLGLPDGLVRHVPRTSITSRTTAVALLKRAFLISLATVPVGGAFCGLAIGIVTESGLIGLLAGTWWVCYGVIFVSAQVVVASGSPNLGSAIFYTFANVGQILLTVPLVLAGMASLTETLLATCVGCGLAALISLGLAVTKQRRTDIPPSLAMNRSEVPPLGTVWRDGAFMGAARIVQGCLIWSPVWAAGVILPGADTANVALAGRLTSAVGAVIAAIRFSIRPELATNAASGNWAAIERRGRSIALAASSIAVLSIVGAAALADPVLTAAFGTEFSGAHWILVAMLFATLAESFGGPVDEVLRMSGYAREAFVAQAVLLPAGFGAEVIAAALAGPVALASTFAAVVGALYGYFVAKLYRSEGVLVLTPPLSRVMSTPTRLVSNADEAAEATAKS
ncbi:lipopolysaccharide biosynthesis protein [Nocardioides soli]|uniref:O-antigen/teichoic acid export membrane protein n=1 Tax=Nocardioides soli TaxID=1036020 RepID=A0A7W4VVT2_9ACTN|nr:hypothetical protein [Nocardioides soli]MBB3042237.1 O-antigen/teichoic acid export membrane protein [Nocardioides soli]